MTHNKNLTFLFLGENDPILAKSAEQILSLNSAETFLLLNFKIAVLCYYFANCSFTLTPDFVFLPKTYKPYLLMLFDIYHTYDF